MIGVIIGVFVGEDIDGHTKFYLTRGRHRAVADETEVE